MIKTLNIIQTRAVFTRTFLFFVLLVLFQCFFEQVGAFPVNKPKSSKSTQLLDQGNRAYEHFMYSVAAESYEKYLQVTGRMDENVLIKLSDSYWCMREYDHARRVLIKLSSNPSTKLSDQQRIRLSELEARMENYSKAAFWLNGIAGYELKAAGYTDTITMEGFKEDSVDWHISYLNINTAYREFSPVPASANLLFSSNSPATKNEKASGWDGKSYTRLWTVPLNQLFGTTQFDVIQVKDSISETNIKSKFFSPVYEGSDTKPLQRRGTNFDQGFIGVDSLGNAHLLSGLQSLKFNVATASLDSNKNLYFSSNQLGKEINIPNRIGLMKSKYENGKVTELQEVSLGTISQYSVMHPAINKSGTLMVFSSDKPGGKGGFDLYYSKRENVNMPWNLPETFSQLLNTPGNEVFPYQGPDGLLYFSSDAMAGLGGLDIYRIPLEEAIKGVGVVEHIAYPVNSSSDDFGWVQDSSIMTGYFTSDRLFGNDNIYGFEYVPKPKISHITGIVREKKSQKPMQGATVFLFNELTKEVSVDKTDSTGRYVFDVKNTGVFIVKAVENNCQDECLSIDIHATKTRNVSFEAPKELILEMTFKNSWVLENVLYDYDKWQIRSDAKPSLDSLISILRKYPIQVELGSYTDSRGKTKYNLRLSQLRAESTVRYIVNQGIDPRRIKAKGYGESRLLNRCSDGVNCSEEEHQLNRRTEITVIYNPAPANSIDPNPFKKGQKINIHDLPDNFFDDCK